MANGGFGQQRAACRYYQKGNCRYGQNCKYAHVSNQNNGFGGGNRQNTPFAVGITSRPNESNNLRTIALDDLQNPTMWPFSSFSVNKGLPNIYVGDLSPEEVRLEAYQQMKSTGNMTQLNQQLQAKQMEIQQKKEKIINLLKNPDTGDQLLSGQLLSSNRSIGASSPFGNTSSSPMGTGQFGISSMNSSRSMGTNGFSPFQSQHQINNPFASSSNTASSTGTPFGNVGSSTTNPFAQTSQSPSLQVSAVASNGNPFSQPASSSGFATSPSPSQNSGFTGFSAPSFGSGFTNSSPPSTTISPFASNHVGANPQSAGVQSSNESKSPFAMTTFGGQDPAKSPFSTPFGVATSGDGKPANSPFGSPFIGHNASTTPIAETVKTTQEFQQPFNINGRNLLTTTPNSSKKTQSPPANDIEEERDDAWNRKQFEAPAFTYGKVPTVAPEPMFC